MSSPKFHDLIRQALRAHHEHVGFKDALLDIEFYVIELQNLIKEKNRKIQELDSIAKDLVTELLYGNDEAAKLAAVQRYKEMNPDA